MTITWTIPQTDYALSEDGLTDVINNIHWRVTDSETVGTGDDAVTYTASSYGTQSIGAPDPSTYIPYADVTEAECIAWCQSAMGEEQVAEITASLTESIELQKAPVAGSGTPWA